MSDGLIDSALDFLGESVGDAVDYVWGEEEDGVEIIDDPAAFDPFGGDGYGASGGYGGLPGMPADGYGTTYAPGGYGSAGGAAAASALVQAVLSNPLAQEMLQRAVGVVFGRAPTWSGQTLTGGIVRQLFKQLSKAQRDALSQRLAGMDAPIGLSQAAGQDFLLLWLYDGLRALGVEDIDDLANS